MVNLHTTMKVLNLLVLRASPVTCDNRITTQLLGGRGGAKCGEGRSQVWGGEEPGVERGHVCSLPALSRWPASETISFLSLFKKILQRTNTEFTDWSSTVGENKEGGGVFIFTRCRVFWNTVVNTQSDYSQGIRLVSNMATRSTKLKL